MKVSNIYKWQLKCNMRKYIYYKTILRVCDCVCVCVGVAHQVEPLTGSLLINLLHKLSR